MATPKASCTAGAARALRIHPPQAARRRCTPPLDAHLAEPRGDGVGCGIEVDRQRHVNPLPILRARGGHSSAAPLVHGARRARHHRRPHCPRAGLQRARLTEHTLCRMKLPRYMVTDDERARGRWAPYDHRQRPPDRTRGRRAACVPPRDPRLPRGPTGKIGSRGEAAPFDAAARACAFAGHPGEGPR